jgi:hypothetical protein
MEGDVGLNALRFVYIVAALLAVLSLYLLFTAVLVRFASRYVEKQKEKRRNLFYGLIIEYITSDQPDLALLKDQISVDFDADLFVELVGDMMTQLDGQEVPKLQALLSMPVIRTGYFKKLKSKVPQQQIDACLYYSKVVELTSDELSLLQTYVASPNPLLSHSAASGLLSSSDVNIRYKAVYQVVRNQRISRLALLEILYRFHLKSIDQFDEESELLAKLVVDESIPAENVGVVIRAITDIGYVQLLMVLYDLLESGFRAEDDEVIEALIYSMGQFQFGPAGEWMINTTMSHPNPRIRRSTAQAFQVFNDPTYLPYLMQMANDPELDVRIRAIFAMVSMGPEGHSHLQQLAGQTEELHELIQRIQDEMEDL